MPLVARNVGKHVGRNTRTTADATWEVYESGRKGEVFGKN